MFNNFVAQNMEISPTVQGTVNCDSPDEKKNSNRVNSF